MRIFIIVAGVLTLSASAALAGSEQYPDRLPSRPITSSQLLNQTGIEAIPLTGAPSAIVAAVPDLDANAAEGIVQTANSLPSAALDGTDALAVAASRSRSFPGHGSANAYALCHHDETDHPEAGG